MVISLTGVLELNFHKVSGLRIARHVGKPVVGVQLTILTAYCLMA
jgi:hypothetical protein